MTKIIINADDFGKSRDRNRAIDDSFKKQLICSAGLIVTGKHLQEAVSYMKQGGYFDKIHLHFNLSANLLHEDSEDIPLTETMRNDPFFCKDSKFIKYHGLHGRVSDIGKWKTVYFELVAQYERFIEITEGLADYKHIDFHLWYNLTWPVSIALKRFTRQYGIKSVRYLGEHQKKLLRNRLFYMIGKSAGVRCIPATNIDYYLNNRESFSGTPLVELYCHPNYKGGVFLDDSPSYLKHDRQPMEKQISELRQFDDIQFVSWDMVL